VVAVAAGRDHSLAILRNGQMLSWGRNVVGELGDGSLTQRNAPVTVTGISTAVHCAGGHGHSLAVLQDGSVWAWGTNDRGALGLDLTGGAAGTIIPFMIPGLRNAVMVAAGALFSAALLADGTVRVWGANSLGSLGLGDTEERRAPVPVPGLSNIVHISAGLFHLLAVDRDGNVFSSGPGVGGELGRALPDPSLGLDPRFQYAYAAGQLASFSGPL
jgi:alpha-tubulin suppressor-like RCC1 family protein